MGPLKYLPVFVVAWIYDFIVFVTWHLNFNFPTMGMDRDSLGAMIVTPVGKMGFRDAYAPFFRSTGQWMIMTVNAAHKEMVVVGDKPEVATIVNVNCVIDHRYLYSGGAGKDLIPTF